MPPENPRTDTSEVLDEKSMIRIKTMIKMRCQLGQPIFADLEKERLNPTLSQSLYTVLLVNRIEATDPRLISFCQQAEAEAILELAKEQYEIQMALAQDEARRTELEQAYSQLVQQQNADLEQIAKNARQRFEKAAKQLR